MLVLVTLLTSLTALLIVAAPLPAYHGTSAANVNSRSILYRRAPPEYNIPRRLVTPSQRKDTIDRMKAHYETEATEEQKQAKFASVASRWNQVSPNSVRESLTFNYHEGENEYTPILLPQAKIYRDKPVPKLVGYVNPKHREEIMMAAAKRYNILSPADAGRVQSMKVLDDWGLNGGILDKTTLTFHSTIKPTDKSTIGDPVTIHRPLTVKPPDASAWDKMTIENNVRRAHKMIAADPQHPAMTSNYATVHSGWQDGSPDENGLAFKKLVMKLEEVSDDEQRKKHLGYYSVQMGASEYERVSTPPPHTETSHAGNEVPHPSSSQQHSNAGPSNPGSPHLNSQGGSQFTTGTLSHPAPSHHELLYPTSPQHHLQYLIDSPPPHNEHYVPSSELWHPESPRHKSPPTNSQMLPHTNNPSAQFGAGTSSHPGPSDTELLGPISPQQSLQPHVVTPPLNSQILHPNSPPSRPRPPSPGSAQSGVPPSHQVGPASNPSGSPHPNHPDDALSPEIWSMLNPDSVYPYQWDSHRSS